MIDEGGLNLEMKVEKEERRYIWETLRSKGGSLVIGKYLGGGGRWVSCWGFWVKGDAHVLAGAIMLTVAVICRTRL
jgi:hypothetical protein